jgi:hypothetical protein
MLTAWNYAIIAAAVQAKRELLEPNLNAQEIRQRLTLLRLGRQVVAQLQGEGVHLPEIDLADPPSPPAASRCRSQLTWRSWHFAFRWYI